MIWAHGKGCSFGFGFPAQSWAMFKPREILAFHLGMFPPRCFCPFPGIPCVGFAAPGGFGVSRSSPSCPEGPRPTWSQQKWKFSPKCRSGMGMFGSCCLVWGCKGGQSTELSQKAPGAANLPCSSSPIHLKVISSEAGLECKALILPGISTFCSDTAAKAPGRGQQPKCCCQWELFLPFYTPDMDSVKEHWKTTENYSLTPRKIQLDGVWTTWGVPAHRGGTGWAIKPFQPKPFQHSTFGFFPFWVLALLSGYCQVLAGHTWIWAIKPLWGAVCIHGRVGLDPPCAHRVCDLHCAPIVAVLNPHLQGEAAAALASSQEGPGLVFLSPLALTKKITKKSN